MSAKTSPFLQCVLIHTWCLIFVSWQDSKLLIEQHKSGFDRPADVEFEDYSQGVKPSNSESTLNPLKGRKHKIFKKLKVSLTVSEYVWRERVRY